jgi:hypothetical protein
LAFCWLKSGWGDIVAKKRKRKIKINYRKIALVFVLLQAFAYTWAHLFLSYKIGVEIAPAVSVAFYAFCGGEVGLVAWLSNNDNKRGE